MKTTAAYAIISLVLALPLQPATAANPEVDPVIRKIDAMGLRHYLCEFTFYSADPMEPETKIGQIVYADSEREAIKLFLLNHPTDRAVIVGVQFPYPNNASERLLAKSPLADMPRIGNVLPVKALTCTERKSAN